MRIFLGAAALALALSGCGGNEPDLAACEDAMRDQFAEALADPNAEEGTRPAECQGVSDADLERIATEIIGEAFE